MSLYAFLIVLSTLVLPSVFLVNHHTREDIGSLLLMGVEVMSITVGVTATVKNIANRARPYVYNTDLSFEQRTDSKCRASFFSGHTSITAGLFIDMLAILICRFENIVTKNPQISLLCPQVK